MKSRSTMMRRHFRREPPPWWPPHERWPPADAPGMRRAWHNMRGRFFRRVGCLLASLSIFACGGFAMLLWMLGVINAPRDLPHPSRPVGIVALVLVVAGLVLAGRALR